MKFKADLLELATSLAEFQFNDDPQLSTEVIANETSETESLNPTMKSEEKPLVKVEAKPQGHQYGNYSQNLNLDLRTAIHVNHQIPRASKI